MQELTKREFAAFVVTLLMVAGAATYVMFWWVP
jgi:multidrug resistance efflux pump